MKPPSALARLTGTPFIALVLFGVYAAVIIGCSQNLIPVWMAAFAIMLAIATGNSVIEVSHYKRWMASWETMARMGQNNPDAERPGWPWPSMLAAVALLFYIPTRHASSNETLMIGYVLVWLFSALYLVVTFFRMALRRRSRKSRKAEQVAAQTMAPVDFMMRRPSSSPSLDDAKRNLPDYAAAMLRDK